MSGTMRALLLFLCVYLSISSIVAIEFDSTITESPSDAPIPTPDFVPPSAAASATSIQAFVPSPPSQDAASDEDAPASRAPAPAPPTPHAPRLLTSHLLEAVDGDPITVDRLWSHDVSGAPLAHDLHEARIALRQALASEMLAKLKQRLKENGWGEEPTVADLPPNSRNDTPEQATLREVVNDARLEYRKERVKQFEHLQEAYNREQNAQKEVREEIEREINSRIVEVKMDPVVSEATQAPPAAEEAEIPPKSEAAGATQPEDRVEWKTVSPSVPSSDAASQRDWFREKRAAAQVKEQERRARRTGAPVGKAALWNAADRRGGDTSVAAHAKSPFATFISEQLNRKQQREKDKALRHQEMVERKRAMDARRAAVTTGLSDASAPFFAPPPHNGPATPDHESFKERWARREQERRQARDRRKAQDMERRAQRQKEAEARKLKTAEQRQEMLKQRFNRKNAPKDIAPETSTNSPATMESFVPRSAPVAVTPRNTAAAAAPMEAPIESSATASEGMAVSLS